MVIIISLEICLIEINQAYYLKCDILATSLRKLTYVIKLICNTVLRKSYQKKREKKLNTPPNTNNQQHSEPVYCLLPNFFQEKPVETNVDKF